MIYMNSKVVLAFFTTSGNATQAKFAGLTAFAHEQQWHVQRIKDNQVSAAKLSDLIDFWQPDGCVVEGQENLRAKDFGAVPTVFIDRQRGSSGRFLVSADNYAFGRIAARELLGLNLPHYAYVAHIGDYNWSRERSRAFGEALKLNDFAFSAFDERISDKAYKQLRKRLSEWLKYLPKPCGIFVANDYMGEEILLAAADAKVRVPEDIAVISVDNDESICENCRPTLSSIEPDHQGAGRLAGQVLQEAMDNPTCGKRHLSYSAFRIVRRASSLRQMSGQNIPQTVLDLIRRKASERLSVSDVVREFGCSRRTAEMRFRSAYGHSILDAIRETRFATALSLVSRPRITMTGVAAQSGFGSTENLRIFIRNRTGLTLSEWKERTLSRQRQFSKTK